MFRRTFLKRLAAIVGGLVAAQTAARAAVPEPGRMPHGYGPCKYRHCSCYKFDGKSNTCKCGHSFYDHQ